MKITASIKWTPAPPFVAGLTEERTKAPLYKKLRLIMFALANYAHNAGGIPTWKISRRVKKYGGVTGTKTGKLRRGWRPVARKPQIINRTSYAQDFYLGHPPRLVFVPSHIRILRNKSVRVKAHYRMEPRQPARPIIWTTPWVNKANQAVTDYYEMK